MLKCIKKQNFDILVRIKEKPYIEIYCDGACSGNPGVGGYGVILVIGNKRKEISGYEEYTTNNRMELTAALKGLESLNKPSKVKIVTDSNYVVKGAVEWLNEWRKKGWRNSKNEVIANKDLWQKLLNLLNKHDVKWEWIKGHNLHPENEKCDKLAKSAINRFKRLRDTGKKN